MYMLISIPFPFQHSGYIVGFGGPTEFTFKGVNCFKEGMNMRLESTKTLNLTKGGYQTVFMDVAGDENVTATIVSYKIMFNE